jgi:hypothetical protein
MNERFEPGDLILIKNTKNSNARTEGYYIVKSVDYNILYLDRTCVRTDATYDICIINSPNYSVTKIS